MREEFNKLKSPPDLRLAEKHARANKVAPIKDNTHNLRCPCCTLNCEREELPVMCATRDFQFIGSGYVLWFSTTVYLSILLFVLFWVNYQKVINNQQGAGCDETINTLHPCEEDWIHLYSIANFGRNFDGITVWTNTAYVVLLYIFVAVFKNKLYNEHKVVDLETDTPADFTIMVTYLPKTVSEDDIKEFFQSHIAEAKVAKVSMAYDVEHLEALQKQKRALYDQVEHLKEEFYETNMKSIQASPSLQVSPGEDPKTIMDPNVTTPEYKEKFEAFVAKRKEVKDHLEDIQQNKEKYFTGIAYVTFERMKHADLYTQKYHMSGIQWFFNCCKYKARYEHKGKSNLIRIDPAPEPTEVLWRNLRYTYRQQIKNKTLTALFVGLILIIAFGIIFGMKYAKNEIKHKFYGHSEFYTDPKTNITSERYEHPLSRKEKGLLTLISIAIFVVCKIFNKIFDHVIESMTEHEKHYSLGHFYSSAVKKTVVSQFFTTSVLIMIAHIILHHHDLKVIWGSGSLLEDMWYLIIFNAFVVPALHLLNFQWIGKLLKRCKVRRKKDTHMYTQEQAHKIYEGPQINIVRGYVTIYQLFLTCLFFTPALPLSPGILMGTLILVYWIEKIYLLRVYALPPLLQLDIAMENLVFVKVGAFVLFAGFAFFDFVLRLTVHPLIIVVLCITFALIFLPVEDMLMEVYQYTGDEAESKIHHSYHSLEHKFDTNYDRLNPVTKHLAILQHMENVILHETQNKKVREEPQGVSDTAMSPPTKFGESLIQSDQVKLLQKGDNH